MNATILALSLLFAQTTVPTQKAAPPKPSPTAPAPVPQLTHEQQLELENLQLKFQMLQTNQQQLQTQYQSYVQSLNAAHPGFAFDVQTGKFVAVPAPPAPPAPAEKK